MHYACRNAGKLYEEPRKKINEVVDMWEICKKNGCSKSKPTLAIQKVTDFNSTVAIDLNIVENKYMLLMDDTCTIFIQGRVLKDENPESIIEDHV